MRHLASGEGRLHLANIKLSVCARQKLKKARANQAGTEGTQQMGNIRMPKQGETLNGTSKRPMPEGSTPREGSDLQKGPGNLVDQGHIRKLYQYSILEAGKGVIWNSERRTATLEVHQAGGRCTHVCVC
jgi:hypothetical protein